MPMHLKTAPTVEPVSVSDALNYIRIDSTSSPDVGYVTNTITVARIRAEQYTNRSFITQTWQSIQDDFTDHEYPGSPEPFAQLLFPPLVSVSSITYLDSNGTSQTLSTSVYTVDTNSEPGRVTLAYSQTWPATYGVPNQVTIEYIAGYGSSASNVPLPIVQAILMDIGHLYENRQAITPQRLESTPMGWENLLSAYRVITRY